LRTIYRRTDRRLLIKRTLQLKGVNSLRTALERFMAIKAIQGNGFVKETGKEMFSGGRKEKVLS